MNRSAGVRYPRSAVSQVTAIPKKLRDHQKGSKRDHRTSKLTALPATTFCPGAGLCVTIMLAAPGGGTGSDVTGVTGGCTSAGGAAGATLAFPTLIPASCSATVTLPSGCPTKVGIT